MRRLLLVVASALCVVTPAAEADSPPANANAGVLRGTATYTNERPHSPGYVYRDVSFTGTFTAAGTRGVPQTYGCTLSGTVVGGAPTSLNGVALGETGDLAGACGRFGAVTCFFSRRYHEVSVLSCSQGVESLYGYGVVTPPLDPAFAPVVEWTFALADAYNAAR